MFETAGLFAGVEKSKRRFPTGMTTKRQIGRYGNDNKKGIGMTTKCHRPTRKGKMRYRAVVPMTTG